MIIIDSINKQKILLQIYILDHTSYYILILKMDSVIRDLYSIIMLVICTQSLNNI